MKMTKRILSLALALVMMLSYIPATALAADSAPVLPTASVKEISNDELTFAMNFKVNPITDEQLAYYGNWYADFELTINKDVTFNADGSADGWLSGQYDEWSENWVNVPFGKFAPTTIKANEPLRIMAFAAEMMDEKGLKYTYKEVYETVRNFDCGVFFDDEFLLANPDLEVKLELKMYNPANEAESYTVGETYTYENPIVAKNTTTNKAYATATEALLDCADGQTVVMLKDSVESVVYVFENMTLDLNGHTLVANYMSSFGNIIDSSASNAGLLKVSPKRIVLQEKNKQLPVRDGDGYRFVKVLRIDTAYVAAEKMFAFQPRFEPGMLELMKQSQDLTGVTIEVQVSWKEDNGRRTQNFVYTDEFVQIYLNSYNPSADRYGQMFTLILDSTEGFKDLTFTALAVSTTGVGVSSDDPIEEEPEYTVPTGMTATYGQTLADVTLPEGFAWKNPAASVGNAGNNTFVAVYTAANIEVEVTVAVAKADPVCTIPNGLTANYGQTLGEIVLPDGFAWKDASASVGNAGVNTFTAIFTPADEANFNAVEVSIPVTVLKINPDYTIPSGLTANYGQTLGEIVLPDGFAWKDASASVGNAGVNTFTAIFTPADEANFNAVEVSIPVTVLKINPDYTIPSGLTANYGQTLGEIVLPDGFAWKDARASVGNAGVNTFTAIFTPADEANFNAVEVSIPVTVLKINPEYTVPTGLTANYGQTLGEIVLPDGFAWKDASASVGNAGVNTFTAIFTPADEANFNAVEVSIPVTVLKINPDYTIPSGLTANYGQTLGEIVLPDGFAWKDASASVGNAGVNTFTAIFTPADEANFNTVEVSIPVTVLKINPEYTVPTGLTANYGQTLGEIVLPDGFAWKDASASVGNAGVNTFTAIFTPADEANFNTVEVSIPVTVLKINPEYTVPTNLTAIYGQKLSEIILPAGFTWKDANASVGNAGTNSFTVVFTPNDTNNYHIVEETVTVVVAKADPTPVIPTNLTAIYGQKLSEIILPAGFTWKNANASVGNAGVNTFVAIYTPEDTQNYNIIEVDVSLTVEKANPDHTIPNGLTATYGQTLAEIILPNGFTWVDANAPVGNAGTNSFTVVFTPADTDNYNIVEETVTVEVAKADPTPVIPSGLTANYNQTLADVTLGSGFEWDDPNTILKTVGVNTFKATYTPADTDNYNTITVEIQVEVIRVPVKKFASKIERDYDFLYRVGNMDTFPVGVLFSELDGAQIATNNVTVTVEGLNYTFAPNASDWKKSTLKLEGAGLVTVTITDNDYCIAETVTIEVIAAKNAYSGTFPSATGSNVVLLENAGAGGFTISGDYWFYGNGYTVTISGNGSYRSDNLNVGFVTMTGNAHLDNVKLICNLFPESYMFTGEMSAGSDGRYPYANAAVIASDNSSITNCYIYGARVNIQIKSGSVTIRDTVTESGSLANIHIFGADSDIVTLDNVTTIQTVKTADFDSSKRVYGFGILVGTTNSVEIPTVHLTGDLRQYNWATQSVADQVTSIYGKSAVNGALNATNYQHTVNGETAVNLGIVYIKKDLASAAKIIDKRDNKTEIPYELGEVTMKIQNVNVTGKVYSIINSEAAAERYDAAKDNVVGGMISTNATYIPQVVVDSNLGGQKIDKTDDADTFCYSDGKDIFVQFPQGESFELDLNTLPNISKYTGQTLNKTITCVDASGNEIPLANGVLSLTQPGEYTVTYAITDELVYDQNGELAGSTTYARRNASTVFTWSVKLVVTTKDTSLPNAYFEFDASKQKMGYYKPALGDVKQYLPFLAGLKIYDYTGKTPYLRFDGSSDFNKVASVAITGYASNKASVEIKLTDGGVIYTQFLARANSGGGSTYTGKIKTSNNTIYFVTDSGTSNKDTTTTAAYWYVDYYKFVGNNGVAIQSAQQTFNSTGSSASTPSGNFSTSIKFTVTYDANGGNCLQSLSYATSASTAVTLPTPTRSGYIFAGWYTAASGGTRAGGAGESYTPSANITLYAQWGKPCTVTYNANGGSCGTTSEKYTGTSLVLPTPTRDGYWFIGWYDAANGGNKIGNAGAAYNPAGEITLYAQWQEAIEYTVTYNANGGTCGTASATYQGTALTLPTPTRTGYEFLGWYTAASGGTKIGDAGASYTPATNITVYAQWQINSYTIKVTTNNATVKVNGTTVNNNGTITIQYGAQVTVEVTYSQTESQSTTIKGTDGTTYTSPFNMPAQNITINATSTAPSSGGGCVTPDTLITLADGTQVRVDELTGNEMLLVWNMEIGKLDAAPIMFIDCDPAVECNIIHLYFSDGSVVKVIYEHGFWDYDLNKYVYLDENAADYIGHWFAKQSGNELAKVQLVDAVIEKTVSMAYSPVTAGHLCYFVNGMLSMPGGVGGLFNIFEVDPETMTYDYEAMAKDIETYGLFTYEEMNAIVPLPEDMFIAAGGAYLKVSIGKGNMTLDDLIYMIERYTKFFPA